MSHSVPGQLYVIAAPSGAGKTSLVSALLEVVPDLQVSVSHTTRAMRPGDVDGKDYFFVDEATFTTMQADNQFLESAKVFNHHYGTSKKWVQESLNQGIDVILEIDWQGARLVREIMPHTVGIFILPPSLDTLTARLTTRAQDDASVIAARMEAAQNEISHYEEFDYCVINDQFETALRELKHIILAQRLKTARQAALHRDLIVGLLRK